MQVIIFHRSHTLRGNGRVSNPPENSGTAKENAVAAFVKKLQKATGAQSLGPNGQGIDVLEKAEETKRQTQVLKADRDAGLSEFSYEVKDIGDRVRVAFEGKYQGKIPIKQFFWIPKRPGALFNIAFLPGTGKVAVLDWTILSTTNGNNGNPNANYIAKALVTETEMLLYLRGRIPNIEGFKNIVIEDTQDSTMAFSHYSSKAKRFLEGISQRRNKLSDVDLYKHIGYLEAQVDVLTEIIVKSDLVKDKDLQQFLRKAQENSVLKNVSINQLSLRLDYKHSIRKLDSVY